MENLNRSDELARELARLKPSSPVLTLSGREPAELSADQRRTYQAFRRLTAAIAALMAREVSPR